MVGLRLVSASETLTLSVIKEKWNSKWGECTVIGGVHDMFDFEAGIQKNKYTGTDVSHSMNHINTEQMGHLGNMDMFWKIASKLGDPMPPCKVTPLVFPKKCIFETNKCTCSMFITKNGQLAPAPSGWLKESGRPLGAVSSTLTRFRDSDGRILQFLRTPEGAPIGAPHKVSNNKFENSWGLRPQCSQEHESKAVAISFF